MHSGSSTPTKVDVDLTLTTSAAAVLTTCQAKSAEHDTTDAARGRVSVVPISEFLAAVTRAYAVENRDPSTDFGRPAAASGMCVRAHIERHGSHTCPSRAATVVDHGFCVPAQAHAQSLNPAAVPVIESRRSSARPSTRPNALRLHSRCDIRSGRPSALTLVPRGKFCPAQTPAEFVKWVAAAQTARGTQS